MMMMKNYYDYYYLIAFQSGKTPLHDACHYGSAYIVEILAQHQCDVNAVTEVSAAVVTSSQASQFQTQQPEIYSSQPEI